MSLVTQEDSERTIKVIRRPSPFDNLDPLIPQLPPGLRRIAVISTKPPPSDQKPVHGNSQKAPNSTIPDSIQDRELMRRKVTHMGDVGEVLDEAEGQEIILIDNGPSRTSGAPD